jgi:hypothetical protein
VATEARAKATRDANNFILVLEVDIVESAQRANARRTRSTQSNGVKVSVMVGEEHYISINKPWDGRREAVGIQRMCVPSHSAVLHS